MKRLVLILTMLVSSRSFALGDIDRGILFLANSYSMGTFIAQMEAQMNQIRADYEKKLAETKLALEQDRRTYLKGYWARSLESAIVHRAALDKEYQVLSQRAEQFVLVLNLSESLFQGVLTREALAAEIKRLNEFAPSIQKDWDELVKAVSMEGNTNALSSAELEQILLQAIELRTQSDELLLAIEESITLTDAEIADFKEKIEALK